MEFYKNNRYRRICDCAKKHFKSKKLASKNDSMEASKIITKKERSDLISIASASFKLKEPESF